MDDKVTEDGEALVECPSCHHTVPENRLTSVFGRQLCLSCAGAWFDEEDENE